MQHWALPMQICIFVANGKTNRESSVGTAAHCLAVDDIDSCARVRLTSEHPEYPIETALQESRREEHGWQAEEPGPQTIWVHFDQPQAIRHIYLCFEAAERRTQEFELLFSNDGGSTYRDIVRQQFNFSPESAPREEENYLTHLNDVTDLKLTIVPDISDGEAYASLRALRVA